MQRDKVIRQVYKWKYGPSETEIVNVGLIGCGGISHSRLLPAIVSEVPELNLVALCDVNETVLNLTGRQYKINRLYTDYKKMLSREDLDAVIIATNDESHVPITIAAAERGVNVWVEKPMALNMRDAERMREAVESSGIKFAVGFNRRFYTAYMRAKRFIDEGGIGKPAAIYGRMWFDRAPVEDALLTWIHMFDLFDYFLGNVDYDSITVRHQLGNDFASLSISLNFASGAVGCLLLSSRASWEYPNERIEIVGDRKAIVVENGRRFYLLAEEDSRYFEPTYSTNWESDHYMSGYAGELQHFANCIITDTKPRVGINEGIAAIKFYEKVKRELGVLGNGS